jgi:hypothetical protein
MKEELRQIAAREANLPAIFHKAWQVENPEFLLCRTQQTSVATVTPLPACPRTAALRLALRPSLSCKHEM